MTNTVKPAGCRNYVEIICEILLAKWQESNVERL